MGEHKWLTVVEIEEYKDAGAFDRFTADWPKMRKLAVALAADWWVPDYPYEDENYVYEPQCRYCLMVGVDQEPASIKHKDWCPYQAYLDMLEATVDD